MEFVDSAIEFLGFCPSDEDDIMKHIENCARRCWKSEGRIDIPNRSFEKFYSHLFGVGHLSAVEHSNIVLEYRCEDFETLDKIYISFLSSFSHRLGFFRIIPDFDNLMLTISGNIRAWVESIQYGWWYVLCEETAKFLNKSYPILFSNFPDIIETHKSNYIIGVDELRKTLGKVDMKIVSIDEQLEYFGAYDDYDIPMYTFVAYCDRGITHEIVRHRVLSFSQESTRYVNYAKRGLQLVNFDIPDHLDDEYVDLMGKIEKFYNKLIDNGVRPQFARNVLPHSTKSEIAMTGRRSGWENFIDLRDSDKAHPDIRFIAQYVRDCFEEIDAGIFDDDDEIEE